MAQENSYSLLQTHTERRREKTFRPRVKEREREKVNVVGVLEEDGRERK
jgi:hypothetical protein